VIDKPAAAAISGLAEGFMIIAKAAGIMVEDTAPAPFGVQGPQVTGGQGAPGGGL
jgi:hypothetical protein